MPTKKPTKWTPELRDAFFNYQGKNSWELEEIIKNTTNAIKLSRKHMGSGSLEHLNYLKAKKGAAQAEMNRIIEYHGKENVAESLKGTSTYALKAPIIRNVTNKEVNHDDN